jgi:RNA polymerase sigma factor (sigma-70 family)
MADERDLIPTRQSLLTRLKDWDDDASWQDFFNTYWKLIYSVALKSGLSEQEAQEVVQETVLSIAKKMKEFKYDPATGSFRGYLLQLTKWRITDQFRKRKRQPISPPTNPSEDPRTATIERVPDPAGIGLENIWDTEWENNLVDAALERVKKKVKPRQYQIFDLYVLKNWPAKKVMETLGVSFTQVYLAKHRFSRLLKKEIEQLKQHLI